MRYIIILALVLSSCDSHTELTNDQIIAEAKKCNDAGFGTRSLINGWTNKIETIQCIQVDNHVK